MGSDNEPTGLGLSASTGDIDSTSRVKFGEAAEESPGADVGERVKFGEAVEEDTVDRVKFGEAADQEPEPEPVTAEPPSTRAEMELSDEGEEDRVRFGEDVEGAGVEGDFFGAVDPREMSRTMSFVNTLAKSFSKNFIEDLPKTAATALETLNGPSFKQRYDEIKAVAEEEDVSMEEASDMVLEEKGEVTGLFKGPSNEQVESNPLYQLGEEAGKAADEIFPDNPKFRDEILAGWVPRFAGELGAFAAGTGLGKGRFAASALGASQRGIQEYERAKEAGASDDAAFQTFLLNVGTGALEGLPVARVFARVDKVVPGGIKGKLGRTSVNTVKGFFEEGVQEGVTQTLSNATAGQLYDKTRQLFDGVATSMAIGGLTGGVLNAAATGLNARIRDADTAQEAAQAVESKQFLREQVRKGEFSIDEEFNASILKDDQQTTLDKIDPEDIDPGSRSFKVWADDSANYLRNKAAHWLSSRGHGESGGVTGKAGVLPKDAKKALDRKEGKGTKELMQLRENIREFERSLVEEYGTEGVKGKVKRLFMGIRNDVPEEAFTRVNEVLQGDRAVQSLPENLQRPVHQMRLHIDRLSRALIEEGIATGKLAVKISNNVGTYLTRPYRKHDFDDWENELRSTPEGEQIFNQAIAHIEERYQNEFGASPREVTGKTARTIARELMDADTDPANVWRTGDAAAEGINWGVLMKRGEFAPEIKALMGKYEDGVVRYARSIQKISSLLHTKQFQDDIRQVGTEQGWLYDPKEGNVPDNAQKITSDNSQVMQGLTNEDGNAFWADPEVAQAFKKTVDMPTSSIYEWYVRANGLAKTSLTIFNPTTWVKNVVSGPWFMMSNGHNPISSETRNAFRQIKRHVQGERPLGDNDFLDRAAELNLFGAGGKVGDLQALLKDINPDSEFGVMQAVAPTRSGSRSGFAAPFRLARLGAEKTGRAYAQVDNMFRLAFWRKEINKHAKALYGSKYENLSGERRAEVERIAADKTLANYQDYSSVPKAVRSLRRAPFSNFASFLYEVMRTSVNTYRTAAKEITSSNNSVKFIGARRLLGALFTHSGGLSAAIAAAGQMMAGISMLEEEVEDLREFVAPWDQEGELAVVGREERAGRADKFTFFNVSQIDPFAVWSDPLRAARSGADDDEIVRRASAAAKEHFRTFVEPSLLTQKLFELNANETQYGAQVYSPSANKGVKAAQIISHFWDLFEPGAIESGRELGRSVGINTDGEKVDPFKESLDAIGFRFTEVDPERSISFAASNFQEGVRQDRHHFNRVKFNEEKGYSEMREAMKTANESYEERFKKMQRKVDALYRLGADWDTIEEKLVDAGVAKKRVKQLRRGVPRDVVTTEDFYEEE